mgnify:CR=1 FL=1
MSNIKNISEMPKKCKGFYDTKGVVTNMMINAMRIHKAHVRIEQISCCKLHANEAALAIEANPFLYESCMIRDQHYNIVAYYDQIVDWGLHLNTQPDKLNAFRGGEMSGYDIICTGLGKVPDYNYIGP